MNTKYFALRQTWLRFLDEADYSNATAKRTLLKKILPSLLVFASEFSNTLEEKVHSRSQDKISKFCFLIMTFFSLFTH